jgi:carbamoyltransferase
MLILGVHCAFHDNTACLFDDYRLLAAVSQERLTRIKCDAGRVPDEAIDECLAIAGRRRGDVDVLALGLGSFPERYFRYPHLARMTTRRLRRALGREKQRLLLTECQRFNTLDVLSFFDAPSMLRDLGFRPDIEVTFTNHHLAHALPCLFHTDWDEALLYTADGKGDNAQYSIRLFGQGKLETLYGGDEAVFAPARIDSLGEVYSQATEVLGYKRNRHEGKLTGLAAYGKPVFYEALARHFRVEDNGEVQSDFASYEAMAECVRGLCAGVSREDIAASAQLLLENCLLEAVGTILKRHPRRFLGVAGGVFANVRLNQRLVEELPIEEVFVFPAMGDQGQPYGNVMDYLLRRDGLEHWLAQRYRLDTLYYGRDFGTGIDACLGGDATFKRISTTSIETSAKLLSEGGIVAIYTRGMEYGPRALGARTIMASPLNGQINQILNDRLSRSEFMPFAPVIMADDAETVFDLGPAKRYAARFMTITCGVKDEWRSRIPAVVHVDGTARPQVIERAQNPLYYDILAAYKALTGVPVLVNTSFNVHEEPIINSPQECARALADRRIDYVATEQAVYALA